MLHLLSPAVPSILSHEPPTTAPTGPCNVHERAPACALIHTVVAREWHAGKIRAFLIFRRCNAERTNLPVRSGGRGIRTHEELAPLAVFKFHQAAADSVR